MPPFSPEHVKIDRKMSLDMNDNSHNDHSESSSNDSHHVPFKPLVLELPSAASFSTLATASTSSLSSSSSTTTDASTNEKSSPKTIKRNVSFREDIITEVVTLEPIDHPQDIYDRWYSKRELHIIRHKIRSLLRWYNMRNAHYFQYEGQQQPQVEYYDDDDSQEQRYLPRSAGIPPPPPPPCVTFYEESLFGLEKHLFQEKEQVRELKYNALTAVFSEQTLQKQLGYCDEDRLAYEYAQTSAVSQQEALYIAQINAQESIEYGQELQAQIELEEEQRLRTQQLEKERELELRRMESLETSFLASSQDSELEHLFLGEGKPPQNPLQIFQNWNACFGKLFRPSEESCEIDADEDCWNAPPSRQPQRHPCLNVPPQQQEEEYYRY